MEPLWFQLVTSSSPAKGTGEKQMEENIRFPLELNGIQGVDRTLPGLCPNTPSIRIL